MPDIERSSDDQDISAETVGAIVNAQSEMHDAVRAVLEADNAKLRAEVERLRWALQSIAALHGGATDVAPRIAHDALDKDRYGA